MLFLNLDIPDLWLYCMCVELYNHLCTWLMRKRVKGTPIYFIHYLRFVVQIYCTEHQPNTHMSVFFAQHCLSDLCRSKTTRSSFGKLRFIEMYMKEKECLCVSHCITKACISLYAWQIWELQSLQNITCWCRGCV